MSVSEWVSSSLPYLTPRPEGQQDAWGAELTARGRRGSQRVVQAGEVPAAPDVAGLLELDGEGTVIVRRRVMYLEDRPCELTDTYYPTAIARGTRLAGTARIPGGAVTLLAELGHVGVRVREDVTARMPDEEELAALDIPPGEPVLRLTRVTFDRDDRPIQLDLMTMPARLQRLRYEIRIG
ncbi:GntR family transcriptional regulator [Streptomyces sp. SID1121]|uniref:GntR family transcriptional regulator n=1 Tax=Streptomyces sp. SID1121 TaxID=3425888 RepID=UPI004056354F